MDHRHAADPLTDGSIDRDIERLLEVEPSPEFVARIRDRVANEPAPAVWWWSLTPVVSGAGVLVLLAAAGAWWSLSTPVPHLVRVPPRPITPNLISPPVGSAPPDRAVVNVDAPTRVVRAANLQRGDGVQLPEVIIADNERRGFAMLMMNIRASGDVLPLPSMADSDSPIEPELMDEPTPVVVTRVEVMPVTVAEVNQPEGERQ